MNKSNKRLLPLIVSFFMVISTFVPVFGARLVNDYESHWANKEIQSAFDSGIVKGYEDGSFKPDNAITRAEFFEIVNNTFNFNSTSDTTYTDVDEDAWYAKTIAKAKEAGYIKGYPDGSIKPIGKISREETAVVISNLNALTATSNTADYTDAASISDWSKNDIIAVGEAGIMVGYPDGSFKPKAPITRAEALVAIVKLINHDTSEDVDVPEEPKDEEVPDEPKDEDEEVTTSVDRVNLGMAGDYAILSKTGISSVPASKITGNIGVSPIGATGITGFNLTADSTNTFSTSTQVVGKVYASDYTASTASNLTTAVSNMETAYTDAAGRAANYTELYSGDLSGKTLVPGVYKWGTDVLINSDITLEGGANDVWIFQIAQGIKQASDTRIILKGGAKAENIFWQTAGAVTIGTGAHFEGTILSMTNIVLNTNASINGRLLAQTAVTLDQNIVIEK